MGGLARPAKQVGVVRDMRGRSRESNDIILFPNTVIRSHDGLVSSPFTGLKKNPTQYPYFFFGHPLDIIFQKGEIMRLALCE